MIEWAWGGFDLRVYELQHFLIGLALDGILDDVGVDGLPSLQLLIEQHKIMRLMVELECFILGWETVLDESAWHIGVGKLHDFLQVDVSDVVHDPLDLDVVDVDARGHAEVVHDLIGHQLHVLPRLAHHHLVAQLVIGLHVLIACLKWAHPAD